MPRRFINLFIASGLFLGILVNTAVAEEIKVEGGGAALATVFFPIKEAFEKASGMKLSVVQSNPAKALIALDKGLVDVATAAHPLESIIRNAAKEGVTIDPATMHAFEIEKNRVMIFVHQSNKVASLSKDQLKGIFTGKITNWKAVGGEDRDIVVVWGKNTPGQNELFSKLILDGEPVHKKVKEATDYASIRDIVASTPGAIGIDPMGFAVVSINMPKIPTISSPIIVVTKGKPSAKVQKLFEYYIEEYGFFDK
jgi:phosphate transport system substrate-binding protein